MNNNNRKKKTLNLADIWQMSRILKPTFICSLLLQAWQSICPSAKFTSSEVSKLAVAEYFSHL